MQHETQTPEQTEPQSAPNIPQHLSIQHLLSLPSTQHHQLTHLHAQLLDLSTTNIGALMRSLEFPHLLHNTLTDQLAPLAHQLTHLTQECRTECRIETHNTHNLNTLLLRHTDNIDAIMQIPSLMHSCLLQDMFNDVLDLHQYIQTISSKYAHSIPCMNSLHASSRHHMRALISKIIHHLRMTKLSVPHCLRLLTILKRLNLCEDRELRILFLQNRLKHLRDMYRHEHAKFLSVPNVHLLERDTASTFIYDYLLDLTRSLKQSLFPVITQYRTMFHDSQHLDDHIILTSCIYYHVTLPFVNVFKMQLKHINSAEKLAKLADECRYTSQTLAKIGADLRHLLHDAFLAAMRTHLDSLLVSALHEFEQNVRAFNAWQPTDTAYATTITNTQKELLTYRPISILTNALLTTLNELREFPIIQLSGFMINTLEHLLLAALAQCAHIKSQYPFDDTERQQFTHFVHVLGNVLPQYMVDCLRSIFDSEGHLNRNQYESLLKTISNEARYLQEF